MEKIVSYDEAWCKVYFMPEIETVGLEWHGFAKGEKFREACNASLELLIKKGAYKMLADNRFAKVVMSEDQEWMHTDWFPRAYEEGYRGSAVLVGDDVFREVSVKQIVNEMDKGKFVVQFFREEQEAFDWLKAFAPVVK